VLILNEIKTKDGVIKILEGSLSVFVELLKSILKFIGCFSRSKHD